MSGLKMLGAAALILTAACTSSPEEAAEEKRLAIVAAFKSCVGPALISEDYGLRHPSELMYSIFTTTCRAVAVPLFASKLEAGATEAEIDALMRTTSRNENTVRSVEQLRAASVI